MEGQRHRTPGPTQGRCAGALILGLSLSLSYLPSSWSQVPEARFTILPIAMEAEQEQRVLFTVTFPTPATAPIPIIVVQYAREGDEIIRRWELNDEGLLGDRIAHDGHYARKADFKELHPGTLRFAVVTGAEAHPAWSAHPAALRAELPVTPRRSFLDIVCALWQRVFP